MKVWHFSEMAYHPAWLAPGGVAMGVDNGVPFELPPPNPSPADLMKRFWEAHDLILKAMTSHDGPFNWEGRHFHYRQVNVWPRPYQQPHPPVWMAIGSPDSAMAAAERGYVIGTLNTGYTRTPAIYGAYRRRAGATGHEATLARFALMDLLVVRV